MIETTINLDKSINNESNDKSTKNDKSYDESNDKIIIDKLITNDKLIINDKSTTTTIDNSTIIDKQSENDNQINSTLILNNRIPIKNGQLFGPFTDPLHWLAIRHSTDKTNLPKEISNNLDSDLLNLFNKIQMANSIDEQNMEIIVKQNKFYFKAMRSIDLDKIDTLNVNDKKEYNNDNDNNSKEEIEKEIDLFAWFSNELSSRLPTPGVSLINGNKRYFCTKCNQVFVYPNPAILHILFTCTKQQPSNDDSNNNINNIINSNNITSSIEKSISPNIRSDKLDDNLNTMKKSATTSSSSTLTPPIDNNNYTLLNGSISLSNSKILKNLEAKLCKQFNSNISNDTIITSNKSSTKTSSSSKKRLSFDIDSLVNNNEPINNKKQKSKNDNKLFKIPTPVSTSNNNTINQNQAINNSNSLNTNNSTIINSLNSPLINATSYLNPFSFLDSNTLASSLANSAFHKVDQNLNKSNFTESNLSTSMFNNSNFPNPLDLAAIYAQRNLLQSMYLQSNPLFASQNLANLNLQNSLANSLFAAGLSGNLSGLSGLNNLDPFNLQASTSNSNSIQQFQQQQQQSLPNQPIEKPKKSKKQKESNKLTNQNLISNNDSSSSSSSSSSSKLNQSQSSTSIPHYLQFLPPSLAALSYPQSNWCAKCNISFRMTSDLVYHMRSQHKDTLTANNSTNESISPSKRKREENKLYCTICGEGFRERHHLTRHMISH